MIIDRAKYEQAYLLGRQVHAGTMRITEARDRLIKLGINASSAVDLVYGVKHLLKGRRFTRKLSAPNIDDYLSWIHRDYGMRFLKNAVSAFRQHIEYYQALAKTPMHGHVKLLEKYKEILKDKTEGPTSPGEISRPKRTFLFMTKENFKPELVESGNEEWWSCHSKTCDGDSILVYVADVGVSYKWRATSDAEKGEKWAYVCDVEFVRRFMPPITIGELKKKIPKDDWKVLHTNFRGHTAILLPPEIEVRITALLDEFAGDTLVSDINTITSDKHSDPTTLAMMVNARLGQGEFGRFVRQLWNHRCAVTGSSTRQALEASHIKRWADSNDTERLDPSNGLLLTASLHKLFDAGLISFDDSGKLIVSAKLSQTEQEIFGVIGKRLSKMPSAETASYLMYHRNQIFLL